MQVKQYGRPSADDVTLQSYAEAGHLDSFSIDAGDRQGVLKGTRLDEVAQLEIDGVHFAPAGLNRAGSSDELTVSAAESTDVSGLHAGETATAHVSLKDGRVLNLSTTIRTSRPKSR